MRKYINRLLNDAVINNDIGMVRALYMGSPHDYSIKFEYAKMLSNNGDIALARELFYELLDSRNRNFALLELGKLECYFGDILKAKGYFNELLFSNNIKDKCFALLELGKLEAFCGNRDKAYEYFNEILSIKRNDYYAMMEIGMLEASGGNIDKAKDIFMDLIKRDNNNLSAKNFLSIVLFNNNEFDELISLLSDSRSASTLSVYLYLLINFNVFFDIEYVSTNYGYTTMQLLDYDEYAAVEHIVYRHVGGKASSLFNSNVDVYRLFNDVKKMLTLENKVNSFVFNDIYSIYYPNIGDDGQNYLRVFTLPNSFDILTMYPTYDRYNLDLSLSCDGVNRVKRK